MNSRGQAALEYLMTYGWALVIIVVVAGILFFIMSSPAGGVSCTSSDPTKMPIQSSNVGKTAPQSIKIINGTGGNIATMTFAGAGSFAEDVPTNPGTQNSMQSGAVLELRPTCDTCSTDALASGTKITVAYNDQFGYNKQAIMTCQGTPIAP